MAAYGARMSNYLTTTQVAERLGLTRRAVLARVDAGKLPTAGKLAGLTGAYLFDAEQIEAALEAGTEAGVPAEVAR